MHTKSVSRGLAHIHGLTVGLPRDENGNEVPIEVLRADVEKVFACRGLIGTTEDGQQAGFFMEPTTWEQAAAKYCLKRTIQGWPKRYHGLLTRKSGASGDSPGPFPARCPRDGVAAALHLTAFGVFPGCVNSEPVIVSRSPRLMSGVNSQDFIKDNSPVSGAYIHAEQSIFPQLGAGPCGVQSQKRV